MHDSSKLGREIDERLVYVVPEAMLRDGEEANITFRRVFDVLWPRKLLICLISVVLSLFSAVVLLLFPDWYTAETVLMSSQPSTSTLLSARLGGLVSLAGLAPPTTDDTAEAIAVLRSRDFTMRFIQENKLMPILFSNDWNEEEENWESQDPDDWPDIRDAIDYFDEDVRSVSQDKDTGLVTLTVQWKDAGLAAAWANGLVAKLNSEMSHKALAEAEANISYLRSQLNSTGVVSLQEALGRLMQDEMQKAMLAQAEADYSFKTVDVAQVPKLPSKPNRVLIVAVVAFVSALGTMFVILWHEPTS